MHFSNNSHSPKNHSILVHSEQTKQVADLSVQSIPKKELEALLSCALRTQNKLLLQC